jgi:hypothetical protein
MDNLKQSILSNSWTTLIAVAGIIALAIYSKQLTAAQVVGYILTILLGLGSADGHKTGGSNENS